MSWFQAVPSVHSFSIIAALAVSQVASAALPVDLGEGVDRRYDPIEARQQCVDGQVGVDVLRRGEWRYIEATGKAELEASLAQEVGVQFAGLVTGSASTNVDFEFGTEAGMTAFVFSLETVGRRFSLSDDDDVHGVCDESIPEDYDRFLDTCGTSWLQRETLGGHVVVMVYGTSLTTQLELEGEFDGEATLSETISGSNTSTGRLFSLLEAGLVDASVQVVGFPTLGFGQTSPQGLFTVDANQLRQYMTVLESELVRAIDPGNSDRTRRLPAYGMPLEQVEQTSTGLMQSCQVELPPSVELGLHCADDAMQEHARAQESQASKGRPELDAGYLANLLEESDLWDWGENFDFTRGRYEEAARHVRWCHQEVLPARIETCNSASFEGDYENLCERCALPRTTREVHGVAYSCSEADLDALAQSLPPVRPRSPEPASAEIPWWQSELPRLQSTRMVQDERRVTLAARESHVCGLTSISGQFQGGGERIELVPADYWTLEIDSKRSEASERLSAMATCVNKNAFGDASGSEPTWLDEASTRTSSSGGVALEGAPYTSVLAGLRGRLDGSGDGAFVQQGSPATVTAAGATQRAFAYSFGVDVPSRANGNVSFYSLSANSKPADRVSVKTLEKVSDAVCMLTSVNGEFDGGGEGVQLVHGSQRWELQTRSVCIDTDGWFGAGTCIDRKPVSATAVCYGYDQE